MKTKTTKPNSKQIADQFAVAWRRQEVANKLIAEGKRFKSKAAELIVALHHKQQRQAVSGFEAEKDLRLIRDHEIRAETFREAGRLVENS